MRIQVIGVHWGAYIERNSLAGINEPTCAMEYTGPTMETRDEIEDWLGAHSGDFSEVMDFACLPEIEFKNQESEFFYHDCMYPEYA